MRFYSNAFLLLALHGIIVMLLSKEGVLMLSYIGSESKEDKLFINRRVNEVLEKYDFDSLLNAYFLGEHLNITECPLRNKAQLQNFFQSSNIDGSTQNELKKLQIKESCKNKQLYGTIFWSTPIVSYTQIF